MAKSEKLFAITSTSKLKHGVQRLAVTIKHHT